MKSNNLIFAFLTILIVLSQAAAAIEVGDTCYGALESNAHKTGIVRSYNKERGTWFCELGAGRLTEQYGQTYAEGGENEVGSRVKIWDTVPREDKGYDNPYLLDEEIDEALAAIDELNGMLDTLKENTYDSDLKRALEELSEELSGIEGKIENIDNAMELIDIIRGKDVNWRDVEYNDAKPGIGTRFKRGFFDIFIPKGFENNDAETVQDFYKEMDAKKQEYEFYSMPLKDRLKAYAYQKAYDKIQDYVEDAASEVTDKLDDIMGKSGQFATWAITESIGAIYTELPKGQIQNFYSAYVQYREGGASGTGKPYTHEEAINQMNIDSAEGGVWTGAMAGLQHHEGYE
ncbi:MAG: hypothetical protein ABIF92_03230, partial [archaeon]